MSEECFKGRNRETAIETDVCVSLNDAKNQRLFYYNQT